MINTFMEALAYKVKFVLKLFSVVGLSSIKYTWQIYDFKDMAITINCVAFFLAQFGTCLLQIFIFESWLG